MITQVWTARYVPDKIPDFVDPHITVNEGFFGGDEAYAFEIYLSHPIFSKTKNIEKKAKHLLKQYGFTAVKLIYHGEKPEHLLGHNHTHN